MDAFGRAHFQKRSAHRRLRNTDLAPDDSISKGLNSLQRQLADARKSDLESEASMWATRTGQNPGPERARAQELGGKIDRATYALLKLLVYEVEKRRQMSND